jgi:hypothetical protein
MDFREFIKKQNELLEGLRSDEMDDLQKLDIGNTSLPVLKRYQKQVSDMLKNDPSVLYSMDDSLFDEFVEIFHADIKEILKNDPEIFTQLTAEKKMILIKDHKKIFGDLFQILIADKEFMDGLKGAEIAQLFKTYHEEVVVLIKDDVDNIVKNLTFKEFPLIDLIVDFKASFREILTKQGAEFLKNNDLDLDTIARMIQVVI